MRYEAEHLEDNKYLVSYIKEVEDVKGNKFEVFDGTRTVDIEEVRKAVARDTKQLADTNLEVLVKAEVEKAIETAKLQLEDGKKLLEMLEAITIG